MKYLFLIATFFISINTILAQDEFEYENYVYVTNIKSVIFHPSGQPLEPPVVFLGNPQRLVFSFDDLDNKQKEYSYKIIHCDRNWNPSNLEVLEYVDGFIDEEVDNDAFSVNTFVPYINYTLSLPNDDLTWLISGNYLLVIYEGDDVDDRFPVITRRFMVVDKKVNLRIKPRRPLDVLKIDTHHEVDLFVNNKDFKIINPQTTVTVDVLQNYRWDTAITGLTPKFIVGDEMTIDNTGTISFPALKEYRSVDIRSLDYIADGVHSIDLKAYGTDVLLDLARPRRNSHYTTVPDANGQFVIQNRDIGDDRTGGDYANVIFTLEKDEVEEELYVMGAFTDWKPDEEYRMRYYDGQNVYIAEVLMKQGYYDFHYGAFIDGKLQAEAIEGSWADTENNYQVFVYLREPADRYDRLIGYYTYNSNTFE